MPTEIELINERKRKLSVLREQGIEPYPYRYSPSHKSTELQKKFEYLKAEEKTNESAKVAGRIVALRRMGKATFLKILDQEGNLQSYFRQDDLGKDKYKLLKLFDIGDWIGIEGTVFKTRTGEVTLYVTDFTMLTKSLRPLPEKFHGLKDTEIRYRQRYLDLIVNPEVRKTFIIRTKIVNAIREVLNRHNFLEVETPILQAIYGGAAAKPFISKLNALDMKVYMRISNELYLKRLVVGGFERVYEFSKDFRNEGMDRTHNPEFTQVEFYQAFADYTDMMNLFEEIYEHAAISILGTTKVQFQGTELDFKRPWTRLRMVDAIKKYGDIDVESLSDKDLFDYQAINNLEIDGTPTRGKLIEALFEDLCETHLIQPTFITHHPYESTPLCKKARDNPAYVERFEPFIMNMEMGNAYSELNDPIEQRKLLENQAKDLETGAEEAHPMDEDFIRAIEFGMPPTGGCGLSIDRMTMLFANQPSIRDVLFFPFMKPEVVMGKTDKTKQISKKEDASAKTNKKEEVSNTINE